MQRDYRERFTALDFDVRYRITTVEIGELAESVVERECISAAVGYSVLAQSHYTRIVLAVRIGQRIEQITAVIVLRKDGIVAVEFKIFALIHLITARRVVVDFLNYGKVGVMIFQYRRRTFNVFYHVGAR